MSSPEPTLVSPGSTLTALDPRQFKARLCTLYKRSDFQGYGFNLHADKNSDNPDQYVGRVDENSPAFEAGLLANDRIVEVNGVNVGNVI